MRGRANPDSEPNFYAMPFVGRDGRTVSGVTDMDVMATQGHTSEHNSENTVITPAKTRMASEGNFGLVSLWPEESARHEQGFVDTRTQPMVCAGSPPDETPIAISPAAAASLLSILDSDDWSMLMRPESPGYSTDNTNDDGDGDYNTAQEILQRCAHDTKEDRHDSDQDGNWEVDSDFGGRMLFPIHHTYNHDDNSDGTCSICRVSSRQHHCLPPGSHA